MTQSPQPQQPHASQTAAAPVELDLEATSQLIKRLRHEVGRVVIGQSAVIDQMLTALIARGHCLLVGVPGLAKTVMAKALADALDMKFKRVQFTPDLMPSDITGTNVLQEDPATGRKQFRFLPGPVFTNILLADEINRTPPKTQAALLEAMQEHRVTFGREFRALPAPFFVLATQNPLEQEGTYPLPEAQLDRFMFSVSVTYPTHAEENAIVAATTDRARAQIAKVISEGEVLAMQRLVRSSPTPPRVVRYAAALARATRPADASAPDFIKQFVDCGSGPRAGQYLVLAAKARAILAGRSQAEVDDVRAVALPVLRHRIFTNFTALSENVTPDDLVHRLLDKLPVTPDTHPIALAAPPAEAAEPITLKPDASEIDLIREMRSITARIRSQVQQKIVGQTEVLDLTLTALLAGGHVLLIGVPGLAKTTLVQTFAQVLDLDFKRVQFTPDLMPSDITGTDIMEVDEASRERRFRFIPGPVFTNLLLADEINRTPPKTQAALLEAMQELSVTAGNQTYPLRPPFFVLATQNPIEQEGTYPLPEAQLDRFMFNIHLDYPTAEEEPAIIGRTTAGGGGEPAKVIGAEEIVRVQQLVRLVPVSRHVLTYVTTLVRMTRPETDGSPEFVRKYVHCGAGPRACQNLVLAAKARAVMQGRPNVSIADVRAVSVPVLRHRVFTNFSADAEGVTPLTLIKELIKQVPEPKIDQEKALEQEAGERSSESILVKCPRCEKAMKLSIKAMGRRAKCPSCANVFNVEKVEA